MGPIGLSVVGNETRQDNDVIDLPCAVYAKNETELSWLITSGTVCHENQIVQWPDRLYRCGLQWKRHWVVVTDWTGGSLWWKLDKTMTWPIIKVWSTLKPKLNCRGLSNRVQYVTKTRQDNDMTDYTGAITPKTKLCCRDLSNRV